MTLLDYTKQQERFSAAFSHGGSCCQVTCEACGRTYFVTSPGHGDYSKGELERLLELAKEKPDLYIEVQDYSHVSTAILNRKSVVVGCLCDPTSELSDWIEYYAHELTLYLRDYWKDRREDAMRQADESWKAILALAPNDGAEWQPMKSAPKNATWVEVLLANGRSVQRAHWASNLSGEEQPPFEGWFYEREVGSGKGSGYHQITPKPIAWRPEVKTP